MRSWRREPHGVRFLVLLWDREPIHILKPLICQNKTWKKSDIKESCMLTDGTDFNKCNQCTVLGRCQGLEPSPREWSKEIRQDDRVTWQKQGSGALYQFLLLPVNTEPHHRGLSQIPRKHVCPELSFKNWLELKEFQCKNLRLIKANNQKNFN